MPYNHDALVGGLKDFSPYTSLAPNNAKVGRFVVAVSDWHYGGNGKIVGTVKEKGTPDAPVARRVILHRQRDGVPVLETWSDAAGNYSFSLIDETEKYYVVSFDHTGDYQGVVADNLTPVLM